MGLSESSLKPFSFLSHCKVSCDSPCCVKICGEDNHCNINIDTQQGESHDTLQCDKKLNGFKLDSDNPIFYMYI